MLNNQTDDTNGPVLNASANQDITSGGAGAHGTPTQSGVIRDTGDVQEDRGELVKTKTKAIKEDRKHWEDDFKRMKKDMDILLGFQWDGQEKLESEQYVVNITQRHVQQRTAAIYAKNPTVVARRKDMMDFLLWDENPMSYQMASQTVAQAGQMAQAAQTGDPNAAAQMQQATMNPQAMQVFQAAQALMADIQQGVQARAMKTRICRTMELYFKNKVLVQQNPPFKSSMKQLVRRALATGIGYAKLSIVRETGDKPMSPDELKGMATIQEQMAQIELFMANIADDNPMMTEVAGEKEELRLAMEAMQQREQIVTQEGITFDFPGATTIIPDRKLQHIQGFVGCDCVREEFFLTPDQVQKIWNRDVRTQASFYDPKDNATQMSGNSGKEPKDKQGVVCVWQEYDRTTGLVYWICDGYPDFLTEPASPDITLERFFPWYPLGFNFIEHHKQRMPLSDVFLIRHMQKDMNRAGEGLRQHRIANRPLTAVPKGILDEGDIQKLEDRPAHAVVQLNALQTGQNVNDVLQVVKHPGLNLELYDKSPAFQDLLHVVGTQEANLGGTSNSTATESSIAESSRVSSLQSNMDDLDDFLTELMRDAGKVALMEISPDEVKRVVGAGAVWPQLSGQDISDEIFLEIAAGSSGRPNKAVEVQNFTQAAPILLQIPGISPEWLGRQFLLRLDDRLDLTDAFIAGQPSIQTLNAMAAKPLGQGPAGSDKGGPGAQDPNAQGGQGAQNGPKPDQSAGGPGAQTQNRQAPAAQPVQH